MLQLFARLLLEDSGQDLIEYAFLALFLALTVLLGVMAVGSGVNTGYANIGAQVSAAS